MAPILPFDDPVFVTRPLLPAISDYRERLQAVWDAAWLTNEGTQHNRLEQRLSDELGGGDVVAFSSGTLALMCTLRALRLEGEVIVTPFTFPATVHALTWCGLAPVFADIDPCTMTIDPDAVAGVVSDRTVAILGVHLYGIPCDVERIQEVATARALSVVYDAAHAFGTEVAGRPISAYGDATMFSFHATKLFHTAEGGAVACSDAALAESLRLERNFGILDEDRVTSPGLNAKMSELHAVMGHAVLDLVADERARRRHLRDLYRAGLADVEGVTLVEIPAGVVDSAQYLVVRVDAERFGRSRDELHDALRAFNVHPRKYFHPLCSEYPHYRGLPSACAERLPNAHRVAGEVLAMPFHGRLAPTDVEQICEMVRQAGGARLRDLTPEVAEPAPAAGTAPAV